MIKGATLTIMVVDMDRSIDFYTKKLGFTLSNRWGDNYAEIDAAGMKIGIHPAIKEFPKSENHISVGFLVDNLDRYAELLKTNSVQFTTDEDQALKFAFFSDPDGTPLYFGQMKW